jgi:hypothetical protein
MTKLLGGILLVASFRAYLPGAEASAPRAFALETRGEKTEKTRLSDAQIKDILIKQSIAEYSGSCPCPYSTARNGSHCGRRSAHSRDRGAAPLCFAKDVSIAMVKEYRESHTEE